MKIAYIVLGGILLSLAIRATPDHILLWVRGDSDVAYMSGRSSVVVAEYVLGVLLLRAGIRRRKVGGRLTSTNDDKQCRHRDD
jgi:hypothetical protein